MKTKKTKKLPTSLLTVIVVSAALFIIDLGLSIFFTIYSINTTTHIIQEKVMENAYTAASLLDGSYVGDLTFEDKENQTERYKKAYNTLHSFYTTSEDHDGNLAYIYLLVQKGDKIVFSIDPCNDPAEYLVEEPLYTDAMRKAFTGVAGYDDKPYTDRWGDLYSGYAPVFRDNDKSKEVVAVVGVDVWADYLRREVTVNTAAIVSISLVTIALGVALSLIITHNIRRKLKDVSNELVSLQGDIQGLVGDIEVRMRDTKEMEKPHLEESGDDEITKMKNTVADLRLQIKKYMAYAQEQALIDRLTHVGNRNAYAKIVSTINEKIANKELKQLVVAIYDANGLKAVNDSTGHEFGDNLLKIAANIIQKVYGKENIFRIGGDEFVIIFYGSTLEFMVKDEECKKLIKEFNDTNTDMPFILSLSVGIAQYEVGKDLELLDIFRKADKDMYRNKQEFYKTHAHN